MNTQQFTNLKQLHLIDASSFSCFFMDITEYIYEKQHGDGGTVTAREIASYAMCGVDSQDDGLLTTYSGMIDLMADLGWLDLHAIGTTFDDELLYEFNAIEKGETHA